MAQEWNPSGYLHNVVPQVGIEVSNEPKPEVAASAPPTVETSKVFRQSCSPCHEEDIVRQQRLTRGQWDREIDKMTRWGAKVNPNDRSELLEYRVKQYGPRPRK